MEILVAKSAGFCFGVKRAVDMANNVLSENNNAYCLGKIVHNKYVNDKLQAKGMKIIEVFKSGNRFPGAATKIATGVTGRQTVFTFAEIEILTIFSERILQCLLKPLMMIGAMIDYQIHDNVNIPLFCLPEQLVELLHGTECRVDSVVIGNIISLINKRRTIDGRYP
jgi:hypothetical protein